MNELPPHAKQLLALARSADEPDDAARERVRRGVALAVGVGSAAAAGAASSAGSASASAAAGAAKIGASSSIGVKLALAGAVTVALGAGAWQLRPTQTQVAHERVASQPVARAPIAPQKPAPAEQPAEQLAAPATPVVQEPPATPPAEQPMRTPAEPRRARNIETAKPSNALHAEMTLLQAASTALDHGDLPRARELLKAHRKAHAAGQLGVERRGLEVLLHCIAREAGAGTAARAYLRAEPDGVLSARIAAACKAETQR